MESKLIDTFNLDNGLTLNIYDASRKVAVDRWLVRLQVCIDIAVDGHWFEGHVQMPATPERIRAKLGDTIQYRYQMERNFVDDREKADVFDGFRDSLLTQKKYYAVPDFAARFITMEYAKPAYSMTQS